MDSFNDVKEYIESRPHKLPFRKVTIVLNRDVDGSLVGGESTEMRSVTQDDIELHQLERPQAEPKRLDIPEGRPPPKKLFFKQTRQKKARLEDVIEVEHEEPCTSASALAPAYQNVATRDVATSVSGTDGYNIITLEQSPQNVVNEWQVGVPLEIWLLIYLFFFVLGAGFLVFASYFLFCTVYK